MFKKTLAILMALLLALSFTGCNDPAEQSEPVNIAFVVGIADGESKFNNSIGEFAALSGLPGSDYAFICVEGEPATIIGPGTIPDLSDRGYTRTMMQRVYTSIGADLYECLEAYEPASGEIDMAAATEMAVRSLNARSTGDRQDILVYYCSGRSTTGMINLQETPIYQMDAAASAANAAQMMDADMSGIEEVIWYCCADMGPDEPRLSSAERVKLKSFYEQLFTALGAKKVTFKDDLPLGEGYSFPDAPVSGIAVASVGSVLDAENIEQAMAEPIVIPETQVRFKPDEAEFLDPAAAADAIRPVADYMVRHPDVEILLYGTCAGDRDTENSLRLGRQRADAIKAELIAGGVEAHRITTVTVGVADDPLYRFGLGVGDEASVNRKCVMADLQGEFAQAILAAAK